MRKRIINHNDYPMVIDWSNYKNTHTKLPCKCEGCGCVVYKTINYLDFDKTCYCRKCGYDIKIKQTNFKRFGVDNPFQSEEIKNKIKQTNLKKYGVEYPNQSEKIRDKTKQTNLKKYGVEHVLQSDYGKEKTKKTILKKYGVETLNQSEEIKNKIKQTNLKKYGVEYHKQIHRKPWQIEVTSSKEKLENYLKSFGKKPTTSDLYGYLGFKTNAVITEHLKNWDLYQYIDSYTSIGEKELTEYINSFGFNTQKKRFKFGEIDIYIPELNIGFEFNGDYWHGNPQFYEENFIIRNKGKSAKQLWEKDKKKIESAHMMGIKIHTIWENDWKNHQDETKSHIKSILYG